MPRYKLVIAYDGRPFCGWQKQLNQPSVQASLEAAIRKFSGEEVQVFGAGRTDTGVHASGQVAHFDLEKFHEVERVQGAINYHLGQDPVSILSAAQVDDAFHARFDAVKRGYIFRLLNRRGPPTFRRGLVWHVPIPLDVEVMQTGANFLVGQHDFSTFRDAQCQAKSPVKTVDVINFDVSGDEIHMHVTARSFLHRQIRSFMGSLVEVGRGKYNADWINEILQAKDRARCGPVAPPNGLYLDKVAY